MTEYELRSAFNGKINLHYNVGATAESAYYSVINLFTEAVDRFSTYQDAIEHYQLTILEDLSNGRKADEHLKHT
jgi:hypothetical protein